MESLQTPIMTISIIGYTLALLIYVLCFILSKAYLKKLARICTIGAFVMTTVLLGIRTVLTGTLPLTNLFEFGLFFVWGIAAVFIIIDYKYDLWTTGIFVLPIAIVLLIWLFTLDTSVRPMMPALRSNWLFVHVLSAAVAYGAFAVSFALSIMYLLKDWLLSQNANNKIIGTLPSLELIDEISYKVVFIGMPFLTIMLVTGAIWAEFSWGSYWSWDPKETWALITWLIYAAYLHVRLMRNWRGKKAAVLSIIGFGAVLFTFLGVSYLLPGIHSYA
ncbi:MAG: hypothetical protein APF76_02445 [Desulfitibacter sp. BRH_c19]|nr:MAG: hypothetical protein APF76_02445 [Desulfitibacter sp. BRH_c19]